MSSAGIFTQNAKRQMVKSMSVQSSKEDLHLAPQYYWYHYQGRIRDDFWGPGSI